MPKPTAKLGLTSQVMAHVAALKEGECDVKVDRAAGTVVAVDPEDGVTVFRALRKGATDVWICMFRESARIKWVDREDANERGPTEARGERP